MSTFATVVGLAAAVCTTGANLPQLKKAWSTGQTDDISMNMLLVLASGSALGGVWRATKGHRHYCRKCHQPGADRWARELEGAVFLLSAPAKGHEAFGGKLTAGIPQMTASTARRSMLRWELSAEVSAFAAPAKQMRPNAAKMLFFMSPLSLAAPGRVCG
jgi:hypothetical protein